MPTALACRDELDAAKQAAEDHKEEHAASVAHTLMHMSGDHGSAAATASQQEQMMMQMPQQAMAMQQAMQMPGMMMHAAGMMMHPAWAQMMPSAMQMPMDMTGGKGMPVDASSMYYPAMMMPHGFGTYPGMG